MRQIAIAVSVGLISSAAMGADKEDAERALQRLGPTSSVCYTLKVLRPLGVPESDGKPRFMPLASGLRSGVTGNASVSCTGPGALLKASDRAN